MNKIYKLCEYGVSIYTVNKLKKYTVEELEYKIDEINDISGLGIGKKHQIKEIIKSDEFKNDKNYSVFELYEYGLNLQQIEALYSNNVDIYKITDEEIDSLEISKQLKDKLKNIIISLRIKDDEVGNNISFSTLLESEIKKILNPFEIMSVNMLKNKIFERKEYPINHFIEDLNDLKDTGVIIMSNEGVYYSIPELLDCIEKLKSEKDKDIFIDRINGKTLSEIGNKYGITRERIRQIVERNLRILPIVKEDKYKSIFSTYGWEEDIFCKIFDVEPYVYNFLNLKYKKGSIELVKLYDDERIDEKQQIILDNYLGYIELYDEKIPNNQETILRLFAKHEAIEIISVDELYEKYQKISEKYNLKEIDGIRNFESILSRKNYILNNLNRKMRFYEINKVTDRMKIHLTEILNCEPGEYSTLYFYNLHNELMQELELQNEYELHNLLRILDINNDKNKIIFNKMPHIFIGITDKKIFFEEHLRELAPISVDEAAEFFQNQYGHKYETTSAYLRLEFKTYINNNIISFDIEQLNEDILKRIKERINEDLCTLSNARDIFKMIIGDNYLKYFNSYNFEKIGYRVRGDYIQKDTINNLEEYIINSFLQKKVIYSYDIPLYGLNVIYNILRNCENRFDIIKISENKYLNYSVLENAGISKEELINYGERIKREYSAGDFFNLYSVRNRLGECNLDNEGFEDMFYESLIFHTEGIKKIGLNNNSIFYITSTRDRHEYSAKDVIKDIIGSKEGLKLGDVYEKLEDEYGIKFDNEYLMIDLIRENKYYYNQILNKIYTSKIAYLNEIYEEE